MNNLAHKKAIFILLIMFLAMGTYFYNTNLNYETDIKSFQEFRIKSNELVQLQKKWKNQKINQKKLIQITRQIKPTKQIKIKGIYKLTYENLNKHSLKRLGRLLLNSNLNIKELKLERLTNKVLLHVEIIL